MLMIVLPKLLSLTSMVVLLGWMLYCLVGGLPLLTLKHTDPSDSRMVRGFFNVHYLVLMSFAVMGMLSAAVMERYTLAAATGCIAIVGFTARRLIVMRMDRLRSTMTPVDAPAIRQFRRLHVTGLALNVVLFVGFVSALTLASAEIVTCQDTPPGCRGPDCRVLCSL